MKRLYARVVLWLIRPAIELRDARSFEQSRAEYEAFRSVDRDRYFETAIGDAGSWTPCSSREGRTPR